MKDQIVYIPTPTSELPTGNADYYIVLTTGEQRVYRWENDHFEWAGLVRITHWLKPVILSTLIDQPNWIALKDKSPEKGVTVIGFFPNKDEAGNYVSTAIMRDGELISDYPN